MAEMKWTATGEIKPVSSRMIVARFSGKPVNMSVIQVYTPTAESAKEEINNFYKTLEETMVKIPREDVTIIPGDWNAKIGKDNTGWERVLGRHRYGNRMREGKNC